MMWELWRDSREDAAVIYLLRVDKTPRDGEMFPRQKITLLDLSRAMVAVPWSYSLTGYGRTWRADATTMLCGGTCWRQRSVAVATTLPKTRFIYLLLYSPFADKKRKKICGKVAKIFFHRKVTFFKVIENNYRLDI